MVFPIAVPLLIHLHMPLLQHNKIRYDKFKSKIKE